MKYYLKKPIPVPAVQFEQHDQVDELGIVVEYNNPYTYRIDTGPHGLTGISPGDWILTDAEGNRYPCTDEIFKKTYYEYVPRHGERCGFCDAGAFFTNRGGWLTCNRCKRDIGEKDA